MTRSRIATVAVLLTVTVAAALGAPAVTPAATTWPGCKAFDTQPQAQAAWERAGKPARADGDHDGVVCESLPASAKKAAKCTTTSRTVTVGLSATRYPNVLAHAQRAIAKGWPKVMTINRKGASQRRAKLLQGIPTKPGMDRDEFPMAMARRSYKADVEYVPSSENRSAGSVVGLKLRRFCDGTRFRLLGY